MNLFFFFLGPLRQGYLHVHFFFRTCFIFSFWLYTGNHIYFPRGLKQEESRVPFTLPQRLRGLTFEQVSQPPVLSTFPEILLQAKTDRFPVWLFAFLAAIRFSFSQQSIRLCSSGLDLWFGDLNRLVESKWKTISNLQTTKSLLEPYPKHKLTLKMMSLSTTPNQGRLNLNSQHM